MQTFLVLNYSFHSCNEGHLGQLAEDVVVWLRVYNLDSFFLKKAHHTLLQAGLQKAMVCCSFINQNCP